MSDDVVLEIIKELVDAGLKARSNAITRGQPSENFISHETMPHAAPGAPVVIDRDIWAKLKEQYPNISLTSVNESCVRLIEADKIRLTNTNWVRVNQDGHAYALRTAPQEEPEKHKRVLGVINSLVCLCRAKNRVPGFMDYEIFNMLAASGQDMTIGEINQICVELVIRGKLKILGDLEWLNPQAEGMTYEVVQN